MFLRTACLVLAVALSTHGMVISRVRRQTFVYPEELKLAAQPNPRTKIIIGHAGRTAPQDYPNWYTRTLMQWEGHSKLTPFQSTDPRYQLFRANKPWDGVQ